MTNSGRCPCCGVTCAVGLTVEKVNSPFLCPGCGSDLSFHETDDGSYLYHTDLEDDR